MARHVKKSSAKIILILILVSLGVIIYSNTFRSPFQYDDETYVERNYSIRSFDRLGELALKRGWNGRIVGIFTFFLNYQLQKLNVVGYHIVNLAIHLINSILTFYLIQLLFLTPNLAGSPSAKQKDWLAFFTAAIFLAHPIQTQAVTYISQRLASLATLFYLSSVYFYVKSRLEHNKISYVFCGAAAIAGMFTKEIVFTLPLAFLLIDYCFFADKGSVAGKAVFFIALILIIPFLFGFDLRSVIFNFRVISGSHENDLLDWQNYFLTQPRVVVKYLALLLLPIGQNIDYDFPLSHSFLEPKTLFSFILLAAIIFWAYKMRRKNILISFGVFWFFLTLLVESSLIPIHHVIFEHRLYLPFFGFSLAFCSWLISLIEDRKVLIKVIVVVLLVLSALTFNRNRAWQSKITLWQDALNKSPDKYRPYLNLGNAYAKRKQYDLALEYLYQSLTIRPNSVKSLDNIAGLYLEKGDLNSALNNFQSLLKADPKYSDAYVNVGLIYSLRGDQKSALENYNKAIALKPDLLSAYANRGNLFAQTKDYASAIADYNRALKIDPDNLEALNNRGNAYKEIDRLDEALADYNRALGIDPTMAIAHINRGMIYKNKGEYKKALQDLTQAIKFSRIPHAYLNRSLVFEEIGRYDLALQDLMRARELGFQVSEAQLNRLSRLQQKSQR